MTVDKLYTSLPANHITAKLTNHVQQTRLHNIIDWQLLFTWLWGWLPYRLSKSQSPTTVLFRTTLTQAITLYELKLRDLFNVAIYSFASMNGLRVGHCIQLTEVVHGVCLLFGNFILHIKQKLQDQFELQRTRFRWWKPKLPSTKELFTFIQSRLGLWRSKDGLKKVKDPRMAPLLVKYEETDSYLQNGKPRWWCGSNVCKTYDDENGKSLSKQISDIRISLHWI